MLAEVNSTIRFLSDLLRNKGDLSPEAVLYFGRFLEAALTTHYKDHWFPDVPLKGSGYRCIRINGILDPVVARAVECAGLVRERIHGAFPEELTIWVDPGEVSYRIGENGSVGRIFPPLPGTGLHRQSCFNGYYYNTTPNSSFPYNNLDYNFTNTNHHKRYISSSNYDYHHHHHPSCDGGRNSIRQYDNHVVANSNTSNQLLDKNPQKRFATAGGDDGTADTLCIDEGHSSSDSQDAALNIKKGGGNNCEDGDTTTTLQARNSMQDTDYGSYCSSNSSSYSSIPPTGRPLESSHSPELVPSDCDVASTNLIPLVSFSGSVPLSSEYYKGVGLCRGGGNLNLTPIPPPTTSLRHVNCGGVAVTAVTVPGTSCYDGYSIISPVLGRNYHQHPPHAQHHHNVVYPGHPAHSHGGTEGSSYPPPCNYYPQALPVPPTSSNCAACPPAPYFGPSLLNKFYNHARKPRTLSSTMAAALNNNFSAEERRKSNEAADKSVHHQSLHAGDEVESLEKPTFGSVVATSSPLKKNINPAKNTNSATPATTNSCASKKRSKNNTSTKIPSVGFAAPPHK